MSLLRYSLTFGQNSTPLKNKLDSAVARLDRLCLQDDDGDRLWDEDEDKQRAKLFKWVFGVNHSLLSCLLFTSALRMIRDTGNVLYNRINTEGYKESRDDIEVVSGIAEDIRDALLDYQVCSDRPYATVIQLNQDNLTDGTATGDIRPELQADRESYSPSVKSIPDVDRDS